VLGGIFVFVKVSALAPGLISLRSLDLQDEGAYSCALESYLRLLAAFEKQRDPAYFFLVRQIILYFCCDVVYRPGRCGSAVPHFQLAADSAL
jgi:hypothetical protein